MRYGWRMATWKLKADARDVRDRRRQSVLSTSSWGRGVAATALPHALIHWSAWEGYSRKSSHM
jgi:hypothetical protein